MLNSRYEPIKELSSRAFDEVAFDDDDGEQVLGGIERRGHCSLASSRECASVSAMNEGRPEVRTRPNVHRMPQIVSAQLSARQRTNEIQP